MGKVKGTQPSNQGKQVKAVVASEPNSEQQPPTFCLRRMRKGYDLTECDAEEKAAFADTLFTLSQMTWNQIKHADRHGSGSEKIDTDSIKGDGKEFLPSGVTLLALRFHGKKAMVGYRGEDGVMFHIIWLDRAFSLYNHG